MRSRVMPGSSPTMERRLWVKRLNSVDLPTLGRPTMATRGNVSAPGRADTTDLRYVGKTSLRSKRRAGANGSLAGRRSRDPAKPGPLSAPACFYLIVPCCFCCPCGAPACTLLPIPDCKEVVKHAQVRD